MNKLLRRTILLLLCLSSLIAAGLCFLINNSKVLGQQTSKGWRVWVKTSPCAGGRTDWLSVAQNNPTSGDNYFDSIDLIDSSATCRRAAPDGCTFQEANAEKEKFKVSDRFTDYCCQDYSVWKNTRTGELSVVKGKFATAGYGWQFEDGPMCCEEAEEISGKTGLCGGTKIGGGGGKGEKNGYIGCFKDTSAFDLDGFLERSRNNTPQTCVATCRAKGFKYAAVQYGESCLCGNSYGKYGTADNCNMKCTGDSGQICGGYSANSVYATGEVSEGNDNNSTSADPLLGTWEAMFGDTPYILVIRKGTSGNWDGTLMWSDNGGKSYATNQVTIEKQASGKLRMYSMVRGRVFGEMFGTYNNSSIVLTTESNAQIKFSKRK